MESTVDEQYIKFGILVDGVNEVYEIEQGKIIPAPKVGNTFKTDFLEGIFQTGDSFIMIVDIEKVLATDELIDIKGSVPENVIAESKTLN